MRLIAATLLLLLLVLSATPGGPALAAAAPPTRASMPDIEDEVMCTVCGVPLQEAGDAPFAVRERQFIQGLIARGETKEQIKSELVTQYGDDVLALPKASGFALAAYVVPALIALAALATLAVLAPRWRRRGARREDLVRDAPAVSSVDARRLDEELARFDG